MSVFDVNLNLQNKWTINYLEDGLMKTVTFIGSQLDLATALYMYKQVLEVRRIYD